MSLSQRALFSLWRLACMPGYQRFARSLNRPDETQETIRRNFLLANQSTNRGHKFHYKSCQKLSEFKKLPLTSYEDYQSDIQLMMKGKENLFCSTTPTILEPTSGSTSDPRLIPYNKPFASEFQRALYPWLGDIFHHYPVTRNGTHYWSISPSTELASPTPSTIPVGFADDSEYLGGALGRLCRHLFAVDPVTSKCRQHSAWEYLTLLQLLRAEDLSFLSIWHPSFLLVLLNRLPSLAEELLHDICKGTLNGIHTPKSIRQQLRHLYPMPKRSRELQRILSKPRIDYPNIWPKLTLISCWSDAAAKRDALRLQQLFPYTTCQPKGLLATEGIISLPYRHERVAAITSHYLEFIPHSSNQDLSRNDGLDALSVHELLEGESYRVIITTGNGFCRYDLGDIVRVTGFIKKTPCIEFLGRTGDGCDLVGEKLTADQVQTALDVITKHFSLDVRFALLTPSPDNESVSATRQYTLWLEATLQKTGDSITPDLIARHFDQQLCTNFYYQHARQLNQLEQVKIKLLPKDSTRRYFQWLNNNGRKAGDSKIPVLQQQIDKTLEMALHQPE